MPKKDQVDVVEAVYFPQKDIFKARLLDKDGELIDDIEVKDIDIDGSKVEVSGNAMKIFPTRNCVAKKDNNTGEEYLRCD